eukprot:1120658-Prorocentrum_minimum.AAC.1
MDMAPEGFGDEPVYHIVCFQDRCAHCEGVTRGSRGGHKGGTRGGHKGGSQGCHKGVTKGVTRGTRVSQG